MDVVIGAGIAGAGCAYHLRRAGRDTVLVDAGAAGRATDAALGIVSALDDGSHGPAWGVFGARAAGYYVELAAELEELGLPDHGWARVGELIIGDEERLSATMAQAAEWGERYGDDALGVPELVGHHDVQRLWPGLRADRAVWLDRVGGVDGGRFLAALTRGFQRLGGRTVSGSAALSLRGDTVEVRVDGERLTADVVVLAAGAWSGRLLARAGLPGDWIAPQRGQLFDAHLPGSAGRPIVSTPGRNYLAAFPGDRVVFGSTREDGSGFDAVPTVGALATLTAAALGAAPLLAGAPLVGQRAGLRPRSADGLPVLGRVPVTRNLFLVTGLGHTGLTWGPYAGRVAAEQIVGGGGPADDLPAEFHAARFFGPRRSEPFAVNRQ
ncbi:FAD-binding oxidoreductase [Nonomuraea sp. K274]|uniref:FAD-binding oxidoreductase n=1 Tax=Nonomuraea cypriaca TaxID=1187855 RepID=A0A931A6D1_9ACTN|nr:FAD-binding oxidoreductase [Nonomuraea cypriaca]MBF8184214.1 FAD-binding oxidoreductase [Nonomuraea cypriaca]